MVLSSRGDEAGKVQALDLGADDYVTKPLGMDQLLAPGCERPFVTNSNALVERPVVRTGGCPADLVRRHRIGGRQGASQLIRLGSSELTCLSPLVSAAGSSASRRFRLKSSFAHCAISPAAVSPAFTSGQLMRQNRTSKPATASRILAGVRRRMSTGALDWSVRSADARTLSHRTGPLMRSLTFSRRIDVVIAHAQATKRACFGISVSSSGKTERGLDPDEVASARLAERQGARLDRRQSNDRVLCPVRAFRALRRRSAYFPAVSHGIASAATDGDTGPTSDASLRTFRQVEDMRRALADAIERSAPSLLLAGIGSSGSPCSSPAMASNRCGRRLPRRPPTGSLERNR